MPFKFQTVLVISSATALTVLGAYLLKKRRKHMVPTIWEPVGKVETLYLYPLKSGRRVTLRTAECTEYGVREAEDKQNVYKMRDRALVVYNSKNKEFKTARTYPKMVLIEVSVHDQDHFAIDAPDMPTLLVKIPKIDDDKNAKEEIMLWSNKTFVIDCGDEAATWFSNFITEKESGLRLGFHDGKHRRDITQSHKKLMSVFTGLNNQATGMYSDLSSYLLLNRSSVEDLILKLPNSGVSAENFRPNIIIDGPTAYEEDKWEWIKIGDVVFRMVRPCTRCIFTTIDPDTGVRDRKRQPLKMLGTYRQIKDLYPITWEDETPVMGLNLGLINGGIIKLGDVVCVGKPC